MYSMVCMLSTLWYTSYAFTFHISLQLTRTTNNNSVHLLAPIWAPERLLMEIDLPGSGMAAPTLWRVRFDGVGAEGSPEALHLCPRPSAGQEGSQMPTFHQHLVLFSFPIASSLNVYKMIPRFHTSAYCWVWVLHLFMSLHVSSSGSCRFISLGHFFLGVVVLFWLTSRRSFLYSRY